MTFADGRRVKHPRAANFVWNLRNGKYLYWFHNHGGTWYEDRNPVWVAGNSASRLSTVHPTRYPTRRDLITVLRPPPISRGHA